MLEEWPAYYCCDVTRQTGALTAACVWVGGQPTLWCDHTKVYIKLWKVLEICHTVSIPGMHLTDVSGCWSMELDIHADACKHTFAAIRRKLQQV